MPITVIGSILVYTQLTLLRVMTLLEATAAKARSLGLLQTKNDEHLVCFALSFWLEKGLKTHLYMSRHLFSHLKNLYLGCNRIL